METLILTTNSLTDVSNYAFPVNIKNLELSMNSLTTFNGDFLPNDIESLGLLGNPFNSYSDIINLPENLKTLVIGNLGGDQDLSGLELPDGLEKLTIAVTLALTEEDLATLNIPPNLKILDLSRNKISTLEGIELPSSLRRLELDNNNFTKAEKKKTRRRFRKENPKLKIKF